MADSVEYNDPTANNFPNDYNQSDVDSRTALRTKSIRNKMYGKDVREGIAEGVEISSVVSGQAKKTADDSSALSKDTQAQFKAVQQGATSDTEVKTARYSKADGKTYDVLNDRLDAMDAKPQQAVDNLQIGTRNYLLGTANSKTITGDGTHQVTADRAYLFSDKDYVRGKQMMFSVDVTKTEGTTGGKINAVIGTTWQLAMIINVADIPVNTTKRLTTPITVQDKENRGDFYFQTQDNLLNGSVTLSHVMMVEGTKPTDWSPAPEDSHHHQAFRMGTRFFAHRGALSLAPENSRPAIQKAGNHAGVEIDVHTTADGVWMVMHDGTVDRMTNGSGAISSFTYKDIRNLRFDAGNNLNKYPDEALIIPTLEEALADCKDHRLIPVIEIKVDDTDKYTKENYDELVRLINKFDLKDECMFISFDYNALVEIKKRLPLVEVSWLQSVISDNTIARAQALGVNAGIDSNYTNSSVTLDNIKKVHDAGLKMGVWTLKDDSQRAKLIGMGVDFITTNSLSGERRFADLDMQNGWVNYGGGYHRSYVQEVGPGVVTIYFNILNGSNAVDTKGTVFANIPSWAVPTYNLWNPCIYRDDNGVAPSTFDVIGNELRIGFNWAERKSSGGWISGNVTYHV